MAYRRTIFATAEVYHIFNRSVQEIPLFRSKRDFKIFTEAMGFYLQPRPWVKFSVYRKNRKKYPFDLKKRLVTILAFCVMPTHFHFLLRQEMEKGIQSFVQRLSNSFAHFFSIKYKNPGPVFSGNFKAVHVVTDEQLIHLSRYIHLNPVTAYLVERPEEYEYSSYKIYLGQERSPIVDVDPVLSNFGSPGEYKQFVLNQKDYQRKLDQIKHLLFENGLL